MADLDIAAERVAFFTWFAENGGPYGSVKDAQDVFLAGYRAAPTLPKVEAAVSGGNCLTCGGAKVDPGGLPVCRSCAAPNGRKIEAAPDDAVCADRYRWLRKWRPIKDKGIPWPVYLDPREVIPTSVHCAGADLDHAIDAVRLQARQDGEDV